MWVVVREVGGAPRRVIVIAVTDRLDRAVVRRLDALLAQNNSAAWEVGDLQSVVDLAVQLVSACTSAGITVTSPGQVRTVATSDGTAQRGDELQSDLGEGPCVDSAAADELVRVRDLSADRRWSKWRPRAVEELGVRSMLCLPMFSGEDKAGALNLYSTRVDAFDDRDAEVATALAASSALAAAAIEKISQLETALDTRSMIGQAIGILMASYKIDDRKAFDVLATISKNSNTKLAEVARRLLAQHNAGDYIQP